MSNKIFIFFLYVVLLEYYFGCASPNYYDIKNENEINKDDVDNSDSKEANGFECIPKSSRCTCKCTKDKFYDCDECIVLRDLNTRTCTPGDVIEFFCPLCPCDEEGRHICEKCIQRRIYANEKISVSLQNNMMYRKKREADSFYDYLYKDADPLSTEQRRELTRQAYLQRRQEVIDKRREKQELAEQQAELARQRAEMQKELEYQRRLDEEQRALDAQQDYIDDYVYEDANLQEQDDYFTRKISDKKSRF